MSVIPTGYAEVSLNFIGAAVPRGAVCTFGVEDVASVGPTQIAIEVQAAYVTEITPDLVTSITLSSIRVKMGPNDTGPMVDYATNNSGGSSQDSVVPNAAMLISKVTAVGGRKGRGRMFHPGYGESGMEDGGVWLPAGLAAFQQNWTDFLGLLAFNDVPMVLLHSQPIITPNLVTSLVLQPRAATQKRRLRPL